MDLLARREHCFTELATKLSRQFSDSQAIEQQLRLLAEQNLQSDRRYVETFVRSRVRKGQGPLRISSELRQKGVAMRLISSVFEENDTDWGLVIQSVSAAKYGNTAPRDEREKAKRIRFFQYRGFDFEQIKQVLYCH